MKKRWLEDLDLTIASITMLALFLLTIIGVVYRYVLNNPLVWLEEVQILLVVWTVFLGGSAAFRTGSHMSMEFVYEKFDARGRKILNIIITALTTVVLAFFGYNAIKLVMLYTSSNRMTAILRIPPVFMYGIVPIGCALMIFNDVRALVKGFKDDTEMKSEELS
jgi:TRAP-type C4-dicarboxylate transport system permease small subunit